MHRVLALAGLASMAVVAWAIVGGAAGALYAAAAALALVGLLLPPALKRQRRSRDYGRRSDDHPASRGPAQRDAGHRTAGRRSRPLPGMRRLGFVRELEAQLAEQQDENRALRERLRTELDAVRDANELLEQHRSHHEQARRRLEDGVSRHGRERTLLERELEALHALVRARPSAPWVPASGEQPLEGGSRPALVRPTMP